MVKDKLKFFHIVGIELLKYLKTISNNHIL